MNKTVTVVFVVLGGLFVVLLLIGAGYFLSVTQSDNTARYTASSAAVTANEMSSTSGETASEETFTLTASQKQALSSFGIDPATVPSSISAAEEACFVAELGVDRVADIKAGGIPSAIDFFKAKNCI